MIWFPKVALGWILSNMNSLDHVNVRGSKQNKWRSHPSLNLDLVIGFCPIRASQIGKYPTKNHTLFCTRTHLLVTVASFKPQQRKSRYIFVISPSFKATLLLLLHTPLYKSLLLSLASPLPLPLPLYLSSNPSFRRNPSFQRRNDEVSVGNATF